MQLKKNYEISYESVGQAFTHYARLPSAHE